MSRAHIDLAELHVTVEASQAKTRRRRVVDISPNASEWIRLDSTAGGAIGGTNFRRRWDAARHRAGLIPPPPKDRKDAPEVPGRWSHDIMRHTFASMHYAKHRNEALLKQQMGHSASEETLFRHYRALKTPGDAEKFWAISPKKGTRT
jgi:integrase